LAADGNRAYSLMLEGMPALAESEMRVRFTPKTRILRTLSSSRSLVFRAQFSVLNLFIGLLCFALADCIFLS
jgi:hypothetical protein